MTNHWLITPRALILTSLTSLLFIVACGGSAAELVIVEIEVIKEVIKEVPVVKEVIKEVPVEVIKIVPVVKEVIKEIVVTAVPGPAPVLEVAPGMAGLSTCWTTPTFARG